MGLRSTVGLRVTVRRDGSTGDERRRSFRFSAAGSRSRVPAWSVRELGVEALALPPFDHRRTVDSRIFRMAAMAFAPNFGSSDTCCRS